MAHSAKARRNLRIRNERILRAAMPRTKDGSIRNDKTDNEGDRIRPSFLRRYRDRYECMPHRSFRHGKIGS
jgi:hypothetical protein